MKNLIKIAFICTLILTESLAWSAEEPDSNAQLADIRAIAVYFSHFIRKVQRPFYLYHWRSDPDLVKSEDVQKDPQKYGHKIVETDAPTFIPGLYMESRNRGPAYGGGLYAALDPVATEHFGSYSPRLWALLVMHIPVGFQMLDLRIAKPNLSKAQKDRLQEALTNFYCPLDDLDSGYIDGLFRENLISRPCADMIGHVLTTLKIDGFLYHYHSTDFHVCPSGTDRSSAVVFTSGSWLHQPGADARLYTSRTVTDNEERRMIESAFVFHSTYQSLVSKAAATLWSLTVRFAKGGSQGEDESVTTTYPARFSSPTYAHSSRELHWNDLINQETVIAPERWLQKNIFECGNANFLSRSH